MKFSTYIFTDIFLLFVDFLHPNFPSMVRIPLQLFRFYFDYQTNDCGICFMHRYIGSYEQIPIFYLLPLSSLVQISSSFVFSGQIVTNKFIIIVLMSLSLLRQSLAINSFPFVKDMERRHTSLFMVFD